MIPLRIVLLMSLLFGVVVAEARPRPSSPPPVEAQLGAIEALEQEYARLPRADLLEKLGRIAQAEGRDVEAADFYRRYLAGATVDAEIRKTLGQFINSQLEYSAELEIASEDIGALLYVDGRLAGVLPLIAPLLLPAGQHRFKLQKQDQEFESSGVRIRAGKQLRLQISLASRDAVLGAVPSIALLVVSGADSDADNAALQTQVIQAATLAARESHFAVVSQNEMREAVGGLSPAQRDSCATNLACQEQLAQQLNAVSVLSFTLRPDRTMQVHGQLFDPVTSMISSAADETYESVPASAPSPLPSLIAKMVAKLVQAAAERGRGTLQLTSTPSGANVVIGGRILGQTPLSKEVLAGVHDVSIEMEGYTAHKTQIEVKNQQPTSLDAALQEEVVRQVQRQQREKQTLAGRPRWRFIVGPLVAGAGLILAGFGVSALSSLGHCIDAIMPPAMTCNQVISTQAIGGGFLTGGAVIAAGGVLIMAWPPKRGY